MSGGMTNVFFKSKLKSVKSVNLNISGKMNMAEDKMENIFKFVNLIASNGNIDKFLKFNSNSIKFVISKIIGGIFVSSHFKHSDFNLVDSITF